MMSDNLRGAMWILASVVAGTVMSVGVKDLSGAIHPLQITFVRCVMGLVLVLPFVATRFMKLRAAAPPGSVPLISRRWPLHLLRLWCIKEAVFKANPGNAGQTLADYELARPGDARGEARTLAGQDAEYSSWCESRNCVALAVCR